jgi:hypothetical protein
MAARPPSTFIFCAFTAVVATKAALPARNALREAETFSSFGWHEEHRPGAKAYFMAPFLHFSMQSMHATQRL